uniref:Inhibitor of apoptosis protein 1 n=1 Tax=Spilarctia obliqua nucleopolyhedrovirus TaxID=1638618 RepID=A0A7G9U8F4_9ABAC|nr:inhibitor of apoptosis protein 1 [Spilarctia obliqua nucleopolyhedrovirus]
MNAPLYVINMCEHDASAERVFSMLIERHNSFENYPIDNDAFINSLIVNGFRYAHVDDAVMCEYCGVVIKNWHEDDSVEFVHATLSPYCVYANKIAQNEQFDENASTNAVVVAPGNPRCVYNRLAHPNARRATFKDYWPGALSGLTHKIAEAGMFHTMLGDETACFFAIAACAIGCRPTTRGNATQFPTLNVILWCVSKVTSSVIRLDKSMWRPTNRQLHLSLARL